MSVSKEKLIHIANALELMQNTLKCVICLEMLREPVSTRCGHHFCYLCITNLLSHKKGGRAQCPLCNAVIIRRAVVVNEKLKRQVEGVAQLIKSVEADTGVDILHLKDNPPSSTNEANFSEAAASISDKCPSAKDQYRVEDAGKKEIDKITPERSSSLNISSAEKVKTWLLQNEDDFGSKGILNDFATSLKPSTPCDEDCDVDMVSVSQVVNESHVPIINQSPHIDRSNQKNEVRPIRRSLNIGKNTPSSTKTSTNESFSRLLEKCKNETSKLHSRGKPPEETVDSRKTQANLASDKNIEILPLNTEGSTCHKQQTGKSVTGIPKSTADRDDRRQEKDPSVHSLKQSALQFEKEIDSGTAANAKMHSQSTLASAQDSCEIIPSSVVASCAVQIPTRTVQVQNSIHLLKSTSPQVLNASTKPCSSSVAKPQDKKELESAQKTNSRGDGNSGASSVKFVKAGRFSNSKKPNVPFFLMGRMSRERHYVPMELKFFGSLDKRVLIMDVSDDAHTPNTLREPASDSNSKSLNREFNSIGIQAAPETSPQVAPETSPQVAPETSPQVAPETSPQVAPETSPQVAPEASPQVAPETSPQVAPETSPQVAPEASPQVAVAQTADSDSEDMFPPTPRRIETGGEIVTRRSNNSSVVSDGIMDAETVLFTQPPVSSLNSPGAVRQPPEDDAPPLKSDMSVSLLSKAQEAPLRSDSDDDDFHPGQSRRKSGRRRQRLSSSEESDLGVKQIKHVSKKSKKDPVRGTGRREPTEMDSLPDFLESVESPKRYLQEMKAKFEAEMQAKAEGRRCSPRIARTAKAPTVDITTPPKRGDSDFSDCDILENTPTQRSPQKTRRCLTAKSSVKSFFEPAKTTPKPVHKAHTDTSTRGFSPTPSVVNLASQTMHNRRLSDVPADSLDFLTKEQVPASQNDSVLEESIREQPRLRASEFGLGRNVNKDDTDFAKPVNVPKKNPATTQRPLREKNATGHSPRSVKTSTATESKTKGLQTRKTEASLKDFNSHIEESVLPSNLVAKPSPKLASTTPVKNVSQTFSPVRKRMCFVCSGLGGNSPSLVKKLAAIVGADFSNKFDPKMTTHLIVRTKEDGTTDKTLKYLCAVAAKKWVVSFQWIQKGLTEGKLVPEEKFEALDTTGADGPRRSRISSKLLFANFEFCCFSPFSDITKEQLEELVQLCGATVVQDPKQFSFKTDVLPLCLAQWDEEKEEEYLGWVDRFCVPLVQHDWILECIGRFALVSFWSLLMSEVSDESLRTMGYPPELIEHPPSDTEME